MDMKSVRVAVLCLALATALVLLFVSDRLEIGEPGRRGLACAQCVGGSATDMAGPPT